MKHDNQTIKQLIEQSHIFCRDGDVYDIMQCYDEHFIAFDDSNGNEIFVYYDEVDLRNDLIYKCMNP